MASTPQKPDWQVLHEKTTVVDLHAHPASKGLFFLQNLSRPHARSLRVFDPLSLRTDFQKLCDGGVDVLLSSVVVPEASMLDDYEIPILGKFPVSRDFVLGLLARLARRNPIGSPDDTSYFAVTKAVLSMMDKQVINATCKTGTITRPIKFAKNVDDLKDYLALDEAIRPLVLVHAVEGAHSLEGPDTTVDTLINNLKIFFDEYGVAYLTLAHFYQNAVVAPVFPFPEPNIDDFVPRYVGPYANDLTIGLTEAGKQVVEEMIDMGMIIDLTHCTPTARSEVFDIVKRKNKGCVTATHIGVQAVNPTPYNLQDWEIKAIADTGGVVGCILMNYWLTPFERKLGLAYVNKTISHLVEVAGTEHVAIGSDFDGFTDPPDDLKDASDLPLLTRSLSAIYTGTGQRKYDDATIEKIMGGNGLRMLTEHWGKTRD